MIEVRPVAFGSQEHIATIDLRRKVLRAPLGLDFTKDELDRERDEIHFAALDGASVVGCLLLKPFAPGMIKMRQVAVREDGQGKGLGRKMVEEAEDWARRNNYTVMLLHARDTAVAFYTKLGYRVESDRFEEVGIPHFRMAKGL